MRKLKLKRTLVTFFIISLVCILAYAGLSFSLNFLVANMDINAMLVNYQLFVSCSIGEFLYVFNPSADASVVFADTYAGVLNPMIISIVALVVAGLGVLLLVIGLVRVFAKHKGGFAFYALAWLAMLCIVILGLAGESVALINFAKQLFFGAGENILVAALGLALFVFSVLAVAFVVVTYIIGMKYAGLKEEKVEEPVEEAPVLAEENLAPEEQVEEPIAEVAPEYIPVLEPEPEEEVEQTEEPVEEEVVQEPEEEPAEVEEEPEPLEYVEPEPIPEPQPDETNNHVEVNVNNNPAPQGQAAGIDPNSLASLLREVVRDIVRDEIARNNANQPRPADENRNGGNQTITGATFGGPLVVQYFNGGINGVTPAPAPAPVEEAKPAPAPVEEAKPAPVEVEVQPEPEPVKEEVQPEPAPAQVVVAPAPVAAPVEEGEKVVYERLSFSERLLQADQEILDLYNELKNEILSYGVKSRVSALGDTFRLHKKMYVRITVAGKSLKLYFALNPDDYKDSKIPVQDAGHKDLYAEIPLVFKVRSGLSVRRCKELIQDVMEKDGLEQGEVGKVNWIKEMKPEVKEKAKSKKDEDED